VTDYIVKGLQTIRLYRSKYSEDFMWKTDVHGASDTGSWSRDETLEDRYRCSRVQAGWTVQEHQCVCSPGYVSQLSHFRIVEMCLKP
jgi:hypothetical protein